MKYDFHPAARQELEEAVAYYDQVDPDLGNAFLDEIEQTLERIVSFPEAWTSLSANTRRCRTARFPYGIVYQIQAQRIVIIAVMHLQRKPNYWLERTQN